MYLFQHCYERHDHYNRHNWNENIKLCLLNGILGHIDDKDHFAPRFTIKVSWIQHDFKHFGPAKRRWMTHFDIIHSLCEASFSRRAGGSREQLLTGPEGGGVRGGRSGDRGGGNGGGQWQRRWTVRCQDIVKPVSRQCQGSVRVVAELRWAR